MGGPKTTAEVIEQDKLLSDLRGLLDQVERGAPGQVHADLEAKYAVMIDLMLRGEFALGFYHQAGRIIRRFGKVTGDG